MSNYPGIEAKFRLTEPDNVKVSMTITMTMKQWREIAAALSADKYEEWPLRAAINDLIRSSQTTFYPQGE